MLAVLLCKDCFCKETSCFMASQLSASSYILYAERSVLPLPGVGRQLPSSPSIAAESLAATTSAPGCRHQQVQSLAGLSDVSQSKQATIGLQQQA